VNTQAYIDSLFQHYEQNPALAAFVLLTMFFGVKFSWLAIVAALIAQMLILAAFTKPN
jgi:hypothetical protein